MTLPKVADSLAGRMEVIRLLPLSQAEIIGARSNFIDRAFAGEKPAADHMIVGNELVEIVLSGGYPEALGRKRWARKQDWYHGYVDAIVQRDVRDVAQIEQLALMPKLLSVLAEHSGQLVNYSGIGAALDLNHVTTRSMLVSSRASIWSTPAAMVHEPAEASHQVAQTALPRCGIARGDARRFAGRGRKEQDRLRPDPGIFRV